MRAPDTLIKLSYYHSVMKTATILYDIQHFELARLMERTAKKVEGKHNLRIDMNLVDGYQLLDKLRTNPNYDFVVLHMGQEGEGAYRQADKCRRLTDNSVLVAESVMYPHGMAEVLYHFDAYIGLISQEENLTKLLKKYAFISGEE